MTHRIVSPRLVSSPFRVVQAPHRGIIPGAGRVLDGTAVAGRRLRVRGGMAHGGQTPEGSGDADVVTRILLSDVMCVACIVARTGPDVDRVLPALSVIEQNFVLVRTWGRCRRCGNGDRAILTVT